MFFRLNKGKKYVRVSELIYQENVTDSRPTAICTFTPTTFFHYIYHSLTTSFNANYNQKLHNSNIITNSNKNTALF